MANRNGVERRNKVFPFPQIEEPIVTVADLAKGLVYILLTIAGFLASYTFYQFSNDLKQIKTDVSSLQVSFSALSQHVQDEDMAKK